MIFKKKPRTILEALSSLLKIVLNFTSERTPARPCVVWFTGLSGAGKSTIAERVCAELQKRGRKVEYLDGDRIRALFPGTGFSPAERGAHVRRVGYMASNLEKQGVFVVASLISPYARSRDFVRGLCRDFIEVHVSTPLEVCEKRDPKGLYAAARRGEKPNFTGISDPYEPPAKCELSIDTARLSEDEAFARVMAYLDGRRA